MLCLATVKEEGSHSQEDMSQPWKCEAPYNNPRPQRQILNREASMGVLGCNIYMFFSQYNPSSPIKKWKKCEGTVCKVHSNKGAGIKDATLCTPCLWNNETAGISSPKINITRQALSLSLWVSHIFKPVDVTAPRVHSAENVSQQEFPDIDVTSPISAGKDRCIHPHPCQKIPS